MRRALPSPTGVWSLRKFGHLKQREGFRKATIASAQGERQLGGPARLHLRLRVHAMPFLQSSRADFDRLGD
jgi:hypothetical protein